MLSGAYPYTPLLWLTVCISSASQALAESLGSWGPWSECSKACDGVQTREWQCSAGSTCDSIPAKNTRKCNEHGCLTHEMLIAIITIGGVVLLLLMAIITICITRRHNKEKSIRRQKSTRYPDTVENGNDKNPAHGPLNRRQSFHHFPSQEGQKSHFTEEREKPEGERVEARKTEALQSMPPSSDRGNNAVYEAVNPNYKAVSSSSYQESIQETQVVFGPDDPDDLDSESGSMSSTEPGSSDDDNDGNESPARVHIIYSTVKK